MDYLPVKNQSNMFDIKLSESIPFKAGVFIRKDFDFIELQLGANFARYNQSTSYDIKHKGLHFPYEIIEKDHFWELELIASKSISEKFSPFIGVGTLYQRNPGLYGEGVYEGEKIFTQKINNDRKFNMFMVAGLRYKIQTKFVLVEPLLSMGYTFLNRDERILDFYNSTSTKIYYSKLYYSFGVNFVLDI